MSETEPTYTLAVTQKEWEALEAGLDAGDSEALRVAHRLEVLGYETTAAILRSDDAMNRSLRLRLDRQILQQQQEAYFSDKETEGGAMNRTCACEYLTTDRWSPMGVVDGSGDRHHPDDCWRIDDKKTEKPIVKDYPLSRKTLTGQDISLTAYEMELCIDGLTTMMKEMDSHLVDGAHVAIGHWSTHGDMATLRLRLQGELEKELQ